MVTKTHIKKVVETSIQIYNEQRAFELTVSQVFEVTIAISTASPSCKVAFQFPLFSVCNPIA